MTSTLYNILCPLSRTVANLRREILQNKARYVLIAGSSGSGKSVLSSRLELELRACGKSALSISLDSFYKSLDEIPDSQEAEGKDWDHPGALSREKIQSFFHELAEKGQAELPYYSFELNAPLPQGKILKAQEDTVFLIEGLHSFNTDVLPLSQDIPHLKIYVDTILPDSPEDFDFKLFRTIVRDYELRGRPLAQTLRRWGFATKALQEWILPLVKAEDTSLRFYNSFTMEEYESLRPRALTLLLNALLQAKADFLEHTPLHASTLPYLGTIANILRICTVNDFLKT